MQNRNETKLPLLHFLGQPLVRVRLFPALDLGPLGAPDGAADGAILARILHLNTTADVANQESRARWMG